MARPTLFNEALAGDICERIADGESLRKICKDQDLPERRTVFRWLADPAPERDAFRHQYALAREASADADDDDIRHYSREAAEGRIEPAAARAAVDGLKWSAGKRKPKVYGDKVALVGGDKGDAPIRHNHSFDLTDASDEELEVIERFVRRRAADIGGDTGREAPAESGGGAAPTD